MKLFYKFAISTIVLFTMGVLLLNIVLNDAKQASKETWNHASKYIGKKIKIDKDSLMIVDYSMFKNTYTLSDKTEVNATLVEKLVK